MGFGLLFSGYFFLLFFPIGAMGILPNFAAIGCLLIFASLRRLRLYCPDCKGFRAAAFPLIPLIASALALFVFGAIDFGGAEVWGAPEYIVSVTEIIADISVAVTSVCLFLGVHKLANQVDLPNLASRSTRMISFTVAYGILSVCACAAELVSNAVTLGADVIVALNYVAFAAFILEYLFIFLCLAYFFTCYIRICLEGDEDMPYREDIFDKLVALAKKNKK